MQKALKVRGIPDKSEHSEEHYYSFCLDQKLDQVDNFDNSNLTKLLVDSGASVHIVNDKTKFKNFTKDFNSSAHVIEVADGSRNRSLAVGQGDAEMNILNSEGQLCSIILENALYVPSFAQNIFFLCQPLPGKEQLLFLLKIRQNFSQRIIHQALTFTRKESSTS